MKPLQKPRKRKRHRLAIFAALAVVLCGSAIAFALSEAPHSGEMRHPVDKTVVEFLETSGNYDTFVAALKEDGLDRTLSGPGPFTVFVPNERAFQKLPTGTMESLHQDPKQMNDFLLYHVVPGNLSIADLEVHDQPLSLLGFPIDVRFFAGEVYINESLVVLADIHTRNGIIHVIDDVLKPNAL